jgi:sulfate transporter 4
MSGRLGLGSDNDKVVRPQGKPDLTSSSTSSDDVRRRYKVAYPISDGAETTHLGGEARQFLDHRARTMKNQYKSYSFLDWAAVFLPCVAWLRTYNLRRNLLIDVVAGLSVGAMVVPQGMSYAKLAGLPQVWGLYGAFSPCIVYAAFGSSRQLAVGPVAVTSLLLGSGLPGISGFTAPAQVTDTNGAVVAYNANTPGEYAEQQQTYDYAASQIAIIAGLLYTGVGLLRLGWLTHYLSHAVVSGFMTGASITIGMSQVKYLLGLKVPRYDRLQESMKSLTDNISLWNWRELVMGLAWLVILEACKFVGRKYRRLIYIRAIGPLLVTIISIAIMNIWKLYKAPHNIAIVGNVPKGLPGYVGDTFFPLVGSTGKTLGLAVLVCIIDLAESISIARALALKNKYTLQPTQEIRAIGFANIVGALFNSYTTTGSFSRSAVNNSCGAQTQISSLCTGLFVMVVLLCLTQVFLYMPNNAQGAIIISGVITLFDYKEAVFLWRINKLDFLVWLTAFIVVVFAGVEIGLATSVGLSLLIVLWKVGFPHTAQLGRLPGTNVFRNIKQYPEAQQYPGILAVRIDAPLYYANVPTVRDALEKYEANAVDRAAEAGEHLRWIVIDLSPVAEIDGTAVHYWFDYVREHRTQDITVILANPSKKVVRQLEEARLVQHIGPENIFVRTADAIEYAQEQQLAGTKVGKNDPAIQAI